MKKLCFSVLFCIQLFYLYGQNNNEILLLVCGDDIGSSHSANIACEILKSDLKHERPWHT